MTLKDGKPPKGASGSKAAGTGGDVPRPKGKRGRPTDYTPELGKAICERLAAGETLRSICRTEGMPHERRVREWAADPRHPFSPQYARAREVGYHTMFDELLDISDDARNDWMERQMGKEKLVVLNDEAVRRSELRVNTRKWMLSKALPKVYGDKATVVHEGDAFREFLRAAHAGEIPLPPNPHDARRKADREREGGSQ